MSRQAWLSSVTVFVVVFAGAAQAQQKAEKLKPPEAGTMQVEIRFAAEKAAPGQAGETPTIIFNGRPIHVNGGTLVLKSSVLSAIAGQYWLGLDVEALPEAPNKKLPAHQGLMVKEVLPGSPAAKAGIKPHDVLLKAGKQPLAARQDLINAVQAAKETDLVLDVDRNGKVQKITVRPAKRAGSEIELRAGPSMPGGQMFAAISGAPTPGVPMPGATANGIVVCTGSSQAVCRGSTDPQEIRKTQIRSAIMLLEQAGLQEDVQRIRTKLETVEHQRPKPPAVGGNRSRSLSTAEIDQRVAWTEAFLKQLDTNGNGLIDADEANSDQVKAMMGRIFERMGIRPRYPISINEIKAATANYYSSQRAAIVPSRPDPALAELRKQVEQLRREMRELRKRVEKLSQFPG